MARKKSDEYEAIKALSRNGKTAAEIASALDLSRSRVFDVRHHLRLAGELEPVRTSAYVRITNHLRSQGHRKYVGSLQGILRSAPAYIGDWLLKITPPGASIEDTIFGILKDAYAEENP